MTLAAQLLPEFDQEMSNTRRALERVPWERSDFRPHERSFTLGSLANHIAELPGWLVTIHETEELDVSGYSAPAAPDSTEALLHRFDERVARAREVLGNASDERLLAPWSFRSGQHLLFTLPRVVVLRFLVFSHLIHHRGQLTVYFRLLGVPVPALYGPSGDEA